MKPQNKRYLYLLYGDGPSCFVRAIVYSDEFKKRGIPVEYYRLNSKKLWTLINFFSFFPPLQFFFRALDKVYFHMRQRTLMKKVSKYDVIIAVKYIESQLLVQIKTKSDALLIYDFDDAVWLNMFYGEDEFSKKVSAVDIVTSDNLYLSKKASIYNANSFVVNGPCQIEKFILQKNSYQKPSVLEKTIIIGWIGSPTSIFYLYKIYDALEIIGEKYSNVILKIVGTGKEKLLIPPFEKIKIDCIETYDQNEMIKQVYSFDIGIYPLFLNELSLGRGSLKATIYMSGKIPLVCSAIGENLNIIQNGVNGFLADSTQDWIEKLSILIENPIIRNDMGKSGFDFSKTNYSIENCLDQLLKTVNQKTS